MGKLKDFYESIGGGAGLIIPGCIVLGIIMAIVDCGGKKEREREMARIERQSDSIRLERIERETRILQETIEHRLTFYNKFSKHYSFFNTYEAFDEWLSRANLAAFELMYDIYSEKYYDFYGKGGCAGLAEYLHWESPEYYVTCKRCDYETSFCPDEQYFK